MKASSSRNVSQGRLKLVCLVLCFGILLPANSVRAESYLSSETYKLQNGLTVILRQDNTWPFVAVHVRYRVGVLHETSMASGRASLLQRLLFRTSEHISPETPTSILIGSGAWGWGGVTNFDDTEYWEVVPAINLERVLWMESDRMGFPSLSRFDLSDIRKLVRDDHRRLKETVPFGIAEQRLWQELFPAPHPYHDHLLGAASEIEKTKIGDLKAFFKDWYTPSNAILTLTGDFDLHTAKTWVDQYFSTLEAGPSPPSPVVLPIIHDREIILHHTEQVGTLPTVIVTWLTPAAFTLQDAVCELLTLILQRGDLGRLQTRVIPDTALSLSVWRQGLQAQSVLRITARSTRPEQLTAVVQAIDDILHEIAEQGVRSEELDAVRLWIRKYRFMPLGNMLAEAMYLSWYQMHQGQSSWLLTDVARFHDISPEQIQAFVRDYLRPQQRVIMYAKPAGRSTAGTSRGSR